MRRLLLVLAAGLALAGCGPNAAITCGELRDRPSGFSAEAVEFYAQEVGGEQFDVPASDCDARCERNFTASIERQFRKECRGASADHEPEEAVRDWLNED